MNNKLLKYSTLIVVLFGNILCFGMEDEGKEKVLTLAEIRQELAQFQGQIDESELPENRKAVLSELVTNTDDEANECAGTFLEQHFCSEKYPVAKKLLLAQLSNKQERFVVIFRNVL